MNRILLRRDTSINWTTNNPVLGRGEIGIDLTNGQFKIGDGISTWNLLTYFKGEGELFKANNWQASTNYTTGMIVVRPSDKNFYRVTSNYTSSSDIVTDINGGYLEFVGGGEATDYIHPTGFVGKPETALTGTAVISKINVSDEGHLTSVDTRNITKSDLSIENVENTALSTWAGTSNITTLGAITSGTWNATPVSNDKIATALSGKTYEGLTISSTSGGSLAIASYKNLSIANSMTLAGVDGATLNIGAGGTLGTGAFANTSSYQPLDPTLSALANLNQNVGFITEVANDTFIQRIITGTSNRISILNGAGVDGNVEIDISNNYIGQASITTVGTITSGLWNGHYIENDYLPATFTNKKYEGLSITTTNNSTLNIEDNKLFIVNNSLTLSGTDGSSLNIGDGTTLTALAGSTLGSANQLLGVNNAGAAYENKSLSVSQGPLSITLTTPGNIIFAHTGSSITPSSGTIGTSGTIIKNITTDNFAHVATAITIPYDSASTASTLIERDSVGRANVNALNLGTQPETPTNGDIYLYSSFYAPVLRLQGIDQCLTRNLWTQMSANSIPKNVTAASSVFTGNGGTGVGTLTFPTGFWVPGKTIRISLTGHTIYQSNSAASITVTLGGTTINSPQTSAYITNASTWSLEATIVSYSSTTFWINGFANFVNLSTGSNVAIPITRQVAGSTAPTIATVNTPTVFDILLSKTNNNSFVLVTTSAIISVVS